MFASHRYQRKHHYRSLRFALHLDLVGQGEPLLLLDMSTRTLQGPELHLGVFRLLVACAADWLVYTAEACAASGHVYILGPELHLDVSYPQGPVATYLRTCSLRFCCWCCHPVNNQKKLLCKKITITKTFGISVKCAVQCTFNHLFTGIGLY